MQKVTYSSIWCAQYITQQIYSDVHNTVQRLRHLPSSTVWLSCVIVIFSRSTRSFNWAIREKEQHVSWYNSVKRSSAWELRELSCRIRLANVELLTHSNSLSMLCSISVRLICFGSTVRFTSGIVTKCAVRQQNNEIMQDISLTLTITNLLLFLVSTAR